MFKLMMIADTFNKVPSVSFKKLNNFA